MRDLCPCSPRSSLHREVFSITPSSVLTHCCCVLKLRFRSFLVSYLQVLAPQYFCIARQIRITPDFSRINVTFLLISNRSLRSEPFRPHLQDVSPHLLIVHHPISFQRMYIKYLHYDYLYLSVDLYVQGFSLILNLQQSSAGHGMRRTAVQQPSSVTLSV